MLYQEGIVGGMHGGHCRLYLLCAGGRLVAMDEGLYGKNKNDAGKCSASPDANVNI
jgi:hypothetical protein